jgi:hypothetical protein
MPVSSWSTVAASNNASPPNGAPEGMAPSAVNDTIRQIMADVRTFYDSTQTSLGTTATVSTGSFTVTYTGFSSAVTATATYRKQGRIVTLYIPTASGTSNATTFTITGLAAEVVPLQSVTWPVTIQNSGTAAFGQISTGASTTTLTLLPTSGLTSWTASGTKGLFGSISLTYEATT